MNKNIELINLTPHEIILIGSEKTLKIPASGQVARVRTKTVKLKEVEGLPVNKTVFGVVEGLPEAKKNTIYIVSFIVLNALKGKRQDVVSPDTSPLGAVRDNKGYILGVRGFQVL